MMPYRKTSLAAGIFYLLTFVSIPTISLYSSVRGAGYITGPGPDGPVFLGIVLEMIVALAGIGTAVTLYPVLKRYNEGVALGFVSLRVLEASTIYSGIVSLLSIVTLRQDAAGTLAIGKALAAQYYSTFLFGQSLLPAGNAVLLGYLVYKSRLVPRALPVLGFIGAILLTTSWAGTLLGFIEPVSPASAIMALPIAVWELSLGLYLIAKGFKSIIPGAGM